MNTGISVFWRLSALAEMPHLLRHLYLIYQYIVSMAHNSPFFLLRSSMVRTVGPLISGIALTAMLTAQEAPATAEPAPQPRTNQIVDGVSIEDYRAIQRILLEVAAADKDIAIIDAQMSALRAQRAELNFKAAAREHPELADKLKVMLDSLRERQNQEKAVAREAARLLRKQGT